MIATIFALLATTIGSWNLNGVSRAENDELFVAGDGKAIRLWESSPIALATNQVYAFSFVATTTNLSGTVVCGPNYSNRDIRELAINSPNNQTAIFRAPSDSRVATTRLRVGLWEAKGELAIRDTKLEPLKVKFATRDDLTLGEGEEVDGGNYIFETSFASKLGAISRPLATINGSHFNTFRFGFNDRDNIIFHHSLPNREWMKMNLEFDCYYFAKGSGVIEVSRDGENWNEVKTVSRHGRFECAVPENLFPTRDIFVRVRANEKTYFQICSYSCVAKFRGKHAFMRGATTLEKEDGSIFYRDEKNGLSRLANEGARFAMAKGCPFDIWTIASGCKVMRGDSRPSRLTKELRLSLAANERESTQLILTPTRDLSGVRVESSDLKNSKGDILTRDNIEIDRVGYVRVDRASDDASRRGFYPDPILKQSRDGEKCIASANHLFWIRVRARKNQKAGIYRGFISIASKEYSRVRIPIAVEVYNFSLPDEMTCRTVLGCEFNFIREYQNLATKEELAKVAKKYAKAMSDYRISPYDATSLAKWNVEWPGLKKFRGRDDLSEEELAMIEPVFNWTDWDVAMENAFRDYHFNTFQMRVSGINHGYDDAPMEFLGFKSSSRAYENLIAKYLREIEKHLRDKGWLDKAYVYWMDEPAEKHYPKVMEGMLRLKKYAPGLKRLLTEEPRKELLGGPNIWVPLTPHLHSDGELAARANGDEIWWYICCAPKAPYAGLFIEHPATELRVWLWQTWAEKVSGILIWETTYWTSPTAYPKDGPKQNPYLDTMSWDRNGDDAPGTKRPFGNGDGRLFYPPLASAFGPSEACLSGPVPTIRIEMLRDGLEDFEYFSILSRLLKEKGDRLSVATREKYERLLAVPKEVSSSLTSFATSPKPILEHRERLARAIEDLSRQ